MASSRGGGSRRPQEMKFIYVGPFYPLNDSRVGRTLPKVAVPLGTHKHEWVMAPERYSCSAQNYSIGAALGTATVQLIEAKFGRERDSSPVRRKRHRGRKPAAS